MYLVDPHTLHLVTRMAVTLSGLPCISPFDCIGEPATFAQRWDKWKAEFELYVAASGVEDKLQKRALLLHLAGPGVCEIFKTYPDGVKGDAKEFDKAMTCLSNHFKVKKNVPLVRQKLLASKPNPGETINNFVTCMKSLAEHCNYGKEEDNQVRDIVISHVTNKEMKSKFYLKENLSLSKLLEIVSTYHNNYAMVLASEDTVNRTWKDRGKGDKERITSSRGRANVGDVVSRVTWRKIVKFPVNIPAANVEIMGTWRSVVVRNRINKSKEEAIADAEGNLEENEMAYGR